MRPVWRHRVRHVADVLSLVTGHLGRLERRLAGGRTILMYHRVLPDEECADYPNPALIVQKSAFAEQVRWLAANAEVGTVAAGVGGRGKIAVALSFDDAYLDNFEHVAPVLEANGLRGSFYVPTGPVGSGGLLWFDEAQILWRDRRPEDLEGALEVAGGERARFHSLAAWLRSLRVLSVADRERVLASVRADGGSQAAVRYRLMSVDQVRDLHHRGHEIGSHSANHPALTHSSDRELASELSGSRETLAQWIGAPPKGFCYPEGDMSDRVAQAVRAAGYDYAVTTRPGVDLPAGDPFRLCRRGIKMTRIAGWSGRPGLLAFRSEVVGLHGRLRGETKDGPVADGLPT